MIDHEHRCIFFHQRKVAGYSIISAFGKDPSMPDWHRYNAGIRGAEWQRRKAPEDSYFVFSAIRNPFDRLISGWKYLTGCRDLPLEAILRNLPTEGHDFRHLTQPQVDLLRDPGSGRIVTDYLIRFESLQEDFDQVCDRIGKRRDQLPLTNISPRERGYRKYFTAETRELAERAFRCDLEAFGYDF